LFDFVVTVSTFAYSCLFLMRQMAGTPNARIGLFFAFSSVHWRWDCPIHIMAFPAFPPCCPSPSAPLVFSPISTFADYAGVMDSAIDNGILVNLRMRFTRDSDEKLGKGGWEALEGGGVIPAVTSSHGSTTNSKYKDKHVLYDASCGEL
jgi:hypothetical protein